MQIKRKLTEREQKLLQILINERNKGIKEIAHLARTDVHDLKTVIDSAVDELDLSFLNQNKEIDCTLISTHNEKLKHIENAIDRLAEGNYGACQKCGQPIPEKRLEALPFALYCVQCQKKKEDKNKEANQKSFSEGRDNMIP
ncbi:MAG: TraR/DksA C4-type zinc finger protein [bacterium]